MVRAQMDDKNKALCKLMRGEGYSWGEIAKEVYVTLPNGQQRHPDRSAVRKCVKYWGKPRKKSPGAPKKTIPADDKKILKLVTKFRSKGYVDAAVTCTGPCPSDCVQGQHPPMSTITMKVHGQAKELLTHLGARKTMTQCICWLIPLL